MSRPVVVSDSGPLIALACCGHDDIYAAAVGHLDEGEAQALSLARALGCGVLLDERRGRATAMHLGLPLFGVLGVLLQAKRTGSIERVAPVLDQMQNSGYRISRTLIDSVLKLAGESAPAALPDRRNDT